jgi:hypothetical protein
MQHNNTAFFVKHIPTGIQVKTKTRSGEDNRQDAPKLLEEKLQKHVTFWRRIFELYKDVYPDQKDVTYEEMISYCRKKWFPPENETT